MKRLHLFTRWCSQILQIEHDMKIHQIIHVLFMYYSDNKYIFMNVYVGPLGIQGTTSQGEGSTLSRLRRCARLERGRALRGTAGAKRKEVWPRHLHLGEVPAYHTIPSISLRIIRSTQFFYQNLRSPQKNEAFKNQVPSET